MNILVVGGLFYGAPGADLPISAELMECVGDYMGGDLGGDPCGRR